MLLTRALRQVCQLIKSKILKIALRCRLASHPASLCLMDFNGSGTRVCAQLPTGRLHWSLPVYPETCSFFTAGQAHFFYHAWGAKCTEISFTTARRVGGATRCATTRNRIQPQKAATGQAQHLGVCLPGPRNCSRAWPLRRGDGSMFWWLTWLVRARPSLLASEQATRVHTAPHRRLYSPLRAARMAHALPQRKPSRGTDEKILV